MSSTHLRSNQDVYPRTHIVRCFATGAGRHRISKMLDTYEFKCRTGPLVDLTADEAMQVMSMYLTIYLQVGTGHKRDYEIARAAQAEYMWIKRHLESVSLDEQPIQYQ